MIVHLVRHGEVHNPGRLRYGRLPGFVLSTAGRAQAARAAEHLRARSPVIGAMRTSPLERARETAELIRAALGAPAPEVDERLIEAGSWMDGLPRGFAPGAYARRVRERGVSAARDEAYDAVATRMRAAVDDARRALAGAPGALVVVSHQTPIWLCRLAYEYGLGTERAPLGVRMLPNWYRAEHCHPCSITSLEFDDGTDRLVRVEYWAPP